MKNFVLVIVLLLGVQLFAKANSAELFQYDRAELAQEFAELEALESYLLENEGVDYEALKVQNHPVLANVHLANANQQGPLGALFSIDDMDWSAFAWGFCCCPIGFFLVAINNESGQDSKTSYWIGVVVSAVLGGISNGIYFSSRGIIL